MLTLEPGNSAVIHAVADNEVRRYGDFQLSPDGRFSAFDSSLDLLDVVNFGHSLIYRYDTAAEGGEGKLICASCASTGASPTSDSSLAPHGLNLTDDGRVFFTSAEPFVLRDTNERKDAYEWEAGAVQLVSSGQSPEDSVLLSAGADGKDAYFFTRQTFVHDDENGSAVKVYDAREGGGFFHDPVPFPCAASDECHGAGTEAPPLPGIITVTGSGPLLPTQGRKPCRSGFVRKNGRCVKKAKRRHSRKAGRRHG